MKLIIPGGQSPAGYWVFHDSCAIRSKAVKCAKDVLRQFFLATTAIFSPGPSIQAKEGILTRFLFCICKRSNPMNFKCDRFVTDSGQKYRKILHNLE